jgi:hypothetical protein
MLAMALLLLPAFWVGLRIFGFKWFNDWLSRAPARGKPSLAFDEITAIGSLINSATFHLLGPDNCLTRSLYLQWLLGRLGVTSDLRIGMQLAGGELKAHAWVEIAGQPINDAHDIAERYTAFNQAFATQLDLSK